MQTILEAEPLKICTRALEKWKHLGPLNLEKLISEHKIEFDYKTLVKTYIRYNDLNCDYYG